MSLFEKVFNYQVLSRIRDAGAIALTRHERAWLRTMLHHPAAADALDPETHRKLIALLAGDDGALDTAPALQEKARSAEVQVYHPLLRVLRRMLSGQSGFRLTFRLRNGRVQRHERGFPYQLEYSMVKREWYVLWYHLRRRSWMATKLANIIEVEPMTVPPRTAIAVMKRLAVMQHVRKEQVTVEVVPAYNKELSRILYAFSCFDKDVAYNDAADTYRITLNFPADENDYLRSKIRFLGMRVKVVEGAYFQQRMYESATKALARYGVVSEADGTAESGLEEASLADAHTPEAIGDGTAS
ncbi:hypothetical protein FHS18_004095 [Paenibacillus phyllosphaerae]|uniref:WYL domain-containing protein n=1 Tax=Paenibacillus phyllosphaerae TaxID=274593 RepID=A0A7W5FPA3_9BACL|nr:WYL domain-containing protein [Paenibacillus phyllosphaerae]MBB3112017.1 hypothetical protein [Paenibacillus phyllosphaerae]